MTGRAVVVRAVLGTARHGIVITGWFTRHLAMCETWESERRPVCCDYLAAEVAGEPGSRCDIADVITWRACAMPAVTRTQLADVLSRCPGCAVVAASADLGRCLVADRYGTVASVAVRGPDCPPGLRVLACGSFVHGWLCAGWPLAALDPELQVAVHRARAGWSGLAQGVAVPCSLTVAGSVLVP